MAFIRNNWDDKSRWVDGHLPKVMTSVRSVLRAVSRLVSGSYIQELESSAVNRTVYCKQIRIEGGVAACFGQLYTRIGEQCRQYNCLLQTDPYFERRRGLFWTVIYKNWRAVPSIQLSIVNRSALRAVSRLVSGSYIQELESSAVNTTVYCKQIRISSGVAACFGQLYTRIGEQCRQYNCLL
ncbi:hypothetical protein J6590_006917 [Homalodisca vitripennis]|nr:hypothetical protein J6590_006917 [Homalodisca vitripennis]